MSLDSSLEYSYAFVNVEDKFRSATAVSLSELEPGDRCIVKKVDASSPELKHKLLTMGIIIGAELTVVSIAPLGDPIAVRTLGYSLSLRKSEAIGVLVVKQ